MAHLIQIGGNRVRSHGGHVLRYGTPFKVSLTDTIQVTDEPLYGDEYLYLDGVSGYAQFETAISLPSSMYSVGMRMIMLNTGHFKFICYDDSLRYVKFYHDGSEWRRKARLWSGSTENPYTDYGTNAKQRIMSDYAYGGSNVHNFGYKVNEQSWYTDVVYSSYTMPDTKYIGSPSEFGEVLVRDIFFMDKDRTYLGDVATYLNALDWKSDIDYEDSAFSGIGILGAYDFRRANLDGNFIPCTMGIGPRLELKSTADIILYWFNE